MNNTTSVRTRDTKSARTGDIEREGERCKTKRNIERKGQRKRERERERKEELAREGSRAREGERKSKIANNKWREKRYGERKRK